ncbi:MAG: prepilin-type N-terminal cleavage/methylation domain-containing protein, partial [Nitrospira sp.]|nr:prepilin-type N-terminal cleavage/methylation domain-containing protein [Nitrospira sp.]
MPKDRQMQEQGWSLAELLIVLAIMGIMTMLAGPS